MDNSHAPIRLIVQMNITAILAEQAKANLEHLIKELAKFKEELSLNGYAEAFSDLNILNDKIEKLKQIGAS